MVTCKHAIAVLTDDCSREVSVLGHLFEVFQGFDSFCQHLIFFDEFFELALVLLNLVFVCLALLVSRLILHVKSLSEAFKVVLSIYQIFNGHLRKPKHFDKIVDETLDVVPLHSGIGYVLEEHLQ